MTRSITSVIITNVMTTVFALTTRSLSRLLRLDAGFELTLAVVLFAGLPLGIARAVDLPGVAVLAFGALLVPVAGMLWRDAAAPDLTRVSALAAMNGVVGVAAVAWLAVASDRFTPAGAALVACAGAGLLALAVAQARAVGSIRAVQTP